MKTNIMKKLSLFAAAFAFCAILCAKPIDVDAAVAPTNLYQSDAGTGSVEVSWNNDPTVDDYEVQISSTGVEGTYVSKTKYATKSYYISGLNTGSTYFVRVRAYNSASDYSNWVTIKVDTAPGNISTLKQTSATKSSFTITWNAAQGATGYAIYAIPSSYSSYGNPVAYVNTTSYTMSIPSNAEYAVAVLPYRNAANANVKVPYPTSYPMDIDCVTVPTAPNNLAASRYSKTTTQFLWVPTSTSDNTDGYDVEIYKYTKKGKAKKAKTITVADSYVSTYEDTTWTSKVPFNNAFKFRVRAYVTINGQKIAGDWSEFKQYIPGAYVKSIYRKRYNATSGTLKWRKVTGAQSYTVYWSTSDNGKWKVQKKNVKGTSCTVRYSSSALYNYYYVRANKVKIEKKRKTGPKPASSNTIDIWRFL